MKTWLERNYKLMLSIASLTVIFKFLLLPICAWFAFKNDYMELSIECASAMETEWEMRKTGIDDASNTIQLISCHEYDKLRKTMLIMGLSEESLSFLGLEALELHQRPSNEYVELHKFRER